MSSRCVARAKGLVYPLDNILGGTGSGGTKNGVESRDEAALHRCWLDQLPKHL